MKYTPLIYLLFSFSIFAQESIQTSFIKAIKLKAETLISVDDFESIHYINNNILFKKNKADIVSYSNLQLGNIHSANTFNTLKTNIFYKDLNTVVILDNRLAEIYKIDFNNTQPYKNVSEITTGPDNTIWIFNQDLQQLELYDYKTNTIRTKTLPIHSAVLDLKSNYNYCFLLTTDYIYVYNYFGSLIIKHKNMGFTAFEENNENIILKKENKLFYLKKEFDHVISILTSNFLINQFFVTNETLYIYDNKSLQQLQLKIK